MNRLVQDVSWRRRDRAAPPFPLMLFSDAELPLYPKTPPVARRLAPTAYELQLELLLLVSCRKKNEISPDNSIIEFSEKLTQNKLNASSTNWVRVSSLKDVSQLSSYISLSKNKVLLYSFLSITAEYPEFEDVSNKLHLAGVQLVGDVVQLSGSEIKMLTGIDDETLDSVSQLLALYGLALNKRIPGWYSFTTGRSEGIRFMLP